MQPRRGATKERAARRTPRAAGEPRRWRRARAAARRRLAATLLVGLACLTALCLWQGHPAGVLAPAGPTAAVPVAARQTASAGSAARARATDGVVAVPSATSPVRAAPADPALARRIDALLAGRPGRYSVVVVTPAGAPLYSRLPDAQVEAASLYKLAIMVEAHRQREAGRLDFDEELTLDPAFFLEDTGEWFAVGDVVSVETLLEAMVVDSSNVAAAALLHRVGRDNINATMAGLGLTSTEIRWTPRVGGGPSAANEVGVYNLTSAADMARLFRLLLAGEVVSAEASSAMLDLLVHQAINDRLPAELPAGAVVAHKTGNLPGLVHDAEVLYTRTGPVVVAALSEGVDEGEAAEVIAQLGALVYRAAE